MTANFVPNDDFFGDGSAQVLEAINQTLNPVFDSDGVTVIAYVGDYSSEWTPQPDVTPPYTSRYYVIAPCRNQTFDDPGNGTEYVGLMQQVLIDGAWSDYGDYLNGFHGQGEDAVPDDDNCVYLNSPVNVGDYGSGYLRLAVTNNRCCLEVGGGCEKRSTTDETGFCDGVV